VGTLARHPQADWAAALLQPSPSELPLLLPALLPQRTHPRDPGGAPPAPAAAPTGSPAGEAAGEPLGGLTGSPGGRAPVSAADLCGRAALLAQFPWAHVPRAGARKVLTPLATLLTLAIYLALGAGLFAVRTAHGKGKGDGRRAGGRIGSIAPHGKRVSREGGIECLIAAQAARRHPGRGPAGAGQRARQPAPCAWHGFASARYPLPRRRELYE